MRRRLQQQDSDSLITVRHTQLPQLGQTEVLVLTIPSWVHVGREERHIWQKGRLLEQIQPSPGDSAELPWICSLKCCNCHKFSCRMFAGEFYNESLSSLDCVSVCKMEPNDRRKTTPDTCWRSRPTTSYERRSGRAEDKRSWRWCSVRRTVCREHEVWQTVENSEEVKASDWRGDFSCWSCDYVLKFRVCEESVRNPKHRARRCWSVTMML